LVLEEDGGVERLEETTRGIQYIIDLMEEVQQQLQDLDLMRQELPEGLEESLQWLADAYPDDFLSDGEIPPEDVSPDGRQVVQRLTPVYVKQVTAAIDEHRVRLQALRCKVECAEDQEIEAKIDAAALPIRELEKGVRYGTSNDRELDRSVRRLEMLQKTRKASGRTWPSPGASRQRPRWRADLRSPSRRSPCFCETKPPRRCRRGDAAAAHPGTERPPLLQV
jgi:hypothetical protein